MQLNLLRETVNEHISKSSNGKCCQGKKPEQLCNAINAFSFRPRVISSNNLDLTYSQDEALLMAYLRQAVNGLIYAGFGARCCTENDFSNQNADTMCGALDQMSQPRY